MTYQHTVHFTEKSIKTLVEKNGLEIITIEHYVKCEDYPCISLVCKKTTTPFASHIEQDELGEKGFLEYMDVCEKDLYALKCAINRIEDELILWGLGASTVQMTMSLFDNNRVKQVVDSNEGKKDIEIMIGDKLYKCCTPDMISDESAAIFILSVAWGDDIEQSIRNMGLNNKVYKMQDYIE